MLSEILKLKKEGKVIGFTATTGDLLHSGHCMMLAEARNLCDYLIVGILTDPTHDRWETKNKPVQSVFERWVQLSMVKGVDMVVPFDDEQDLENMLLALLPDIRIVGEEYKNVEFTGKNIKEIKIVYNSRKHPFWSSELRERVVKKSTNVKINTPKSVVKSSKLTK